MTPLLLLGGLAAARRSAGEAVTRLSRNLAAYAVLLFSALVALGFLTAGGFLYMSSLWGAVTASLIIAATYAVTGCLCFLAIRVRGATVTMSPERPLTSTAPSIEALTVVNRDVPGSMIAVGLLAVAGYIAGRIMTRRR